MHRLGMWLQQNLSAKGLRFDDVDWNSFRNALRETDYYKGWRARFGDETWLLLEETAGNLTR